MISLIICSVKPYLLQQLTDNIAATIGIEYEIIAIDNSASTYSICEAYNLGASKAKYEMFCFVHEDILFHTPLWGEVIHKLLEDSEIGLVGGCGATYKSLIPSAWIDVPPEYIRSNMVRRSDDKSLFKLSYPLTPYDNVAVIDGLFMATRREVWLKIKFNEELLKGFHFYDIDFSLRVNQQWKVIVSNEIEIEHLSKGNFNSIWFQECINYHFIDEVKYLIKRANRNREENIAVEEHVFSKFLFRANYNNYSIIKLLAYLRHSKLSLKPLLSPSIAKLFILYLLRTTKTISLRKKRKLEKDILDNFSRSRLINKDFAIISNNCWGGGLYQSLNLPYNTPFVGLFIHAPCYINLLTNFDEHVQSELTFIDPSQSKYSIKTENKAYPVALLSNDIEIHFLHYKSEAEALDKWKRRMDKLIKVNKDNFYYKIDDRDECTKDLILKFHNLPLSNKLSFTKTKILNCSENVKLKNPAGMILYDTTFDHIDIVNWLNTGLTHKTFIHKVVTFVLKYPSKFTL